MSGVTNSIKNSKRTVAHLSRTFLWCTDDSCCSRMRGRICISPVSYDRPLSLQDSSFRTHHKYPPKISEFKRTGQNVTSVFLDFLRGFTLPEFHLLIFYTTSTLNWTLSNSNWTAFISSWTPFKLRWTDFDSNQTPSQSNLTRITVPNWISDPS